MIKHRPLYNRKTKERAKQNMQLTKKIQMMTQSSNRNNPKIMGQSLTVIK